MKQQQGFTLIELLIVVAIIAILAAIAVPNFLEAQVRSKVSRAKADQRSIATALEAYYVDNNRYPPSTIDRLGNTLGGAPINPRIQRFTWITTPVAFMTSIPNDPFAPGPVETNVINRQIPVFTYWDSIFLDGRKSPFPATDAAPLAADVALRFRDMPDEARRRGGWILFSYGPDKDFEAAVSNTNPYTIYDPTNGTASDGDIMRLSGSGVK